jgi:hypothetical protein
VNLTRLEAKSLPVDEGEVRSVSFNADGSILAAGYSSGYKNRESVSNRGGVVLWDVDLRARLSDRPLPVVEGEVESVIFSPDGNTLAACFSSHDTSIGGVVLWDVASRGRLADKPVAMSQVNVGCIAFSPDGNSLAAGYTGAVAGVSGGVVLCDVGLETWKRHACLICNRNLSLNEWRRLFPGATYRPTFLGVPTPRYDENYKDIARNLSRTDWKRYFPDQEFRKTFDNLPIPPDPESDSASASAVGTREVPKTRPSR